MKGVSEKALQEAEIIKRVHQLKVRKLRTTGTWTKTTFGSKHPMDKTSWKQRLTLIFDI